MDTVWRVTAAYFFLMFALRAIGKRDLGKLAPFDLVVILLIPELLSQSLVREDFSLTNGFIGVATLLALVFLPSAASYLSKRVSRAVEGRPAVLVQHGSLVPDAMNRERVSPDEIFAQMHKSGLEHISQVKWGILETDGSISFVPREQGGGQQRQEESDVA